MDEHFKLNGISFSWNEIKAKQNQRKHGVSFKQAAEAFFDPFIRIIDASSVGETRDGIIGMDEEWNLLFVVHIVVESESIRLISARRATRAERRFYET